MTRHHCRTMSQSSMPYSESVKSGDPFSQFYSNARPGLFVFVGFGVVVGSDVAVSVVGFAVIIKKNYNYNFFSTLLSLAGNSGRLTRESTTAARAALPIPINVCRIFVCPNNDGAASARDF